MRMQLLALLLLLNGCSTVEKRTTVLSPRPVTIPVAVKCYITYPTRPVGLQIRVKPGMNAGEQFSELIKSHEAYRVYSLRLEKLLSVCSSPKPP